MCVAPKTRMGSDAFMKTGPPDKLVLLREEAEMSESPLSLQTCVPTRGRVGTQQDNSRPQARKRPSEKPAMPTPDRRLPVCRLSFKLPACGKLSWPLSWLRHLGPYCPLSGFCNGSSSFLSPEPPPSPQTGTGHLIPHAAETRHCKLSSLK